MTARPALRVVSVVSAKGGVGKTTTAANLAAALAGLSERVLLVDLDPQNGARLHHGMPLHDGQGLALQALRGMEWSPAIFSGPFGVNCLPFGQLDEADIARFQQYAQATSGWLMRGLSSIALPSESWVVIDTPPGIGPQLVQALSIAQVALTVLLPDAASFVTIHAMQAMLRRHAGQVPHFSGHWFLLNRMNNSRALCRDVADALSAQLGDQLAPIRIHFDAAADEALASQMPLMRYAPQSLASRDLVALAHWLESSYGKSSGQWRPT
jgi:cellulose synthase operon protein YhjQ